MSELESNRTNLNTSSEDIFYESSIPQMEEEVVTSLPENEFVEEDTEVDVDSLNVLNKSKEEEDLIDISTVDVDSLPYRNAEEGNEIDKNTAFVRLPLTRVKKIMKCDPTLGLASQDSIFLVAKATELFIESLAIEAYQITSASKKKTVSKKDMDTIIEKIDALAFLDGALE